MSDISTGGSPYDYQGLTTDHRVYLCKGRRQGMQMSPLQLVSHVAQKHFAGEQETHCDKTKKSFKFFLSCPSARLLLTSKVFSYHVTD